MPPLPLILAAGGGVLGYVKGLEDRRRSEELNRKNAEVARWSPWTGLKPQQPMASVNPWEAALQGAYTGGMMGVNIGNAADPAAPATLGLTEDVKPYEPTQKDLYSLNYADSPWPMIQRENYTVEVPNPSLRSWSDAENKLWRVRP